MHATFSCHANPLLVSSSPWWEQKMLLGYTAAMKKSDPCISGAIKKCDWTKTGKTATHRDVEKLLGVVQHADPDGDVSSRRHGWGPVCGVQRADAKSLRGSEPLACSGGRRLLVRLCHGSLHRSLPSLRWIQDRKEGGIIRIVLESCNNNPSY